MTPVAGIVFLPVVSEVINEANHLALDTIVLINIANTVCRS